MTKLMLVVSAVILGLATTSMAAPSTTGTCHITPTQTGWIISTPSVTVTSADLGSGESFQYDKNTGPICTGTNLVLAYVVFTPPNGYPEVREKSIRGTTVTLVKTGMIQYTFHGQPAVGTLTWVDYLFSAGANGSTVGVAGYFTNNGRGEVPTFRLFEVTQQPPVQLVDLGNVSKVTACMSSDGATSYTVDVGDFTLIGSADRSGNVAFPQLVRGAAVPACPGNAPLPHAGMPRR